MRAVVDLPEPDSPTIAWVVPARDRERHVVDGAVTGDARTPELLAQALDPTAGSAAPVVRGRAAGSSRKSRSDERRRVVEQPPGVGAGGAIEHAARPARASCTRPSFITMMRSARSAATPEIVRDEQDAAAVLGAEFVEQVEDAPLHGDVERARRLVGDEQLRPQGERGGDQHALAHPARTARAGTRGRRAPPAARRA